MLNYALNYDYIVKNLCENRNTADSTCKGKCFVEKELAKTEKQSNNSQNIKIAKIDVFISKDIFSFSKKENSEFLINTFDSNLSVSYNSEFFSRIFHPPLV